MLALVTPQPRSQRLLRRAWRSVPATRRGARRALGAPARSDALGRRAHSASRRSGVSAVILGAHFLEEESEDLVEAVRRVAADRGTTYVFVGTPEQRRLQEITRGSLISRLVRALPGIDIRIVADRARRDELVA